MILETYHWNGFFIAIALCASVIGLLLLPFLLAQLPKAE
jgi:OPA family sugar phosphate sensor protein UhpC-like MFS transporter